MKNSFKKALNIYKYLAILFSIAFWIYMVIDDYIFIEKFWNKPRRNWNLDWILFRLFIGVYFLLLAYQYANNTTIS